MAKNIVSPAAKRQLNIKISDHWATKIQYTPENDAEFYEKLGHLTAQLMGQEPYELDTTKEAVSVIEVETSEAPTVTAFFYSTIEHLRKGKWTLNRALELEHLPMGMRVKDLNGRETGEIRFSIKNMTKEAAQAVVRDYPSVFTKVEFSDAGVLERKAAREVERAKKVVEDALKMPKKEKKLRPVKQTKQEIVNELFNQPELPQPSIEIEHNNVEIQTPVENAIEEDLEPSSEIENTTEEQSTFDKSVEELLNEEVVVEVKKEVIQPPISEETLESLLDI